MKFCHDKLADTLILLNWYITVWIYLKDCAKTSWKMRIWSWKVMEFWSAGTLCNSMCNTVDNEVWMYVAPHSYTRVCCFTGWGWADQSDTRIYRWGNLAPQTGWSWACTGKCEMQGWMRLGVSNILPIKHCLPNNPHSFLHIIHQFFFSSYKC